ncbi:hypothetical protein BU15DRAFT_60213 [Melanogaster broomeanus]|nr:hypothetical protein BU15DRAFT_60213 [Melanogaster broomeanus]
MAAPNLSQLSQSLHAVKDHIQDISLHDALDIPAAIVNIVNTLMTMNATLVVITRRLDHNEQGMDAMIGAITTRLDQNDQQMGNMNAALGNIANGLNHTIQRIFSMAANDQLMVIRMHSMNLSIGACLQWPPANLPANRPNTPKELNTMTVNTCQALSAALQLPIVSAGVTHGTARSNNPYAATMVTFTFPPHSRPVIMLERATTASAGWWDAMLTVTLNYLQANNAELSNAVGRVAAGSIAFSGGGGAANSSGAPTPPLPQRSSNPPSTRVGASSFQDCVSSTISEVDKLVLGRMCGGNRRHRIFFLNGEKMLDCRHCGRSVVSAVSRPTRDGVPKRRAYLLGDNFAPPPVGQATSETSRTAFPAPPPPAPRRQVVPEAEDPQREWVEMLYDYSMRTQVIWR